MGSGLMQSDLKDILPRNSSSDPGRSRARFSSAPALVCSPSGAHSKWWRVPTLRS